MKPANNKSAKILVVDDEADIRELLEITLTRMGMQTDSAANLEHAKELLAKKDFDLCLTDMNLPDGNGLELVDYIQEHHNDIPVAMITAYGSTETAVLALKAGAFDFVSKPVDLERLRTLVSTALKIEKNQSDKIKSHSSELLGNTDSVKRLRSQINKLARSQAPVYISGESGTGKELVSRLIHANGPRSNGPFIPVNCGAIPSELMESEFFGHVKGSFTGANESKIGLFQAAKGGTLFLDEVADLPLNMQVKLLRSIQEKAIRPIGSNEEIPTDVRILSATHKNLAKEVEAERFRSDLYYRINVIELQVPSLRDRQEDIPILAEHFLKRLAENLGTQPASLANDAKLAMRDYFFPGNVRELENILERAYTLCEDNIIHADDLQLKEDQPATIMVSGAFPKVNVSHANGNLEGFLEDIEREALSRALEASRWNKTKAAEMLGLSFRSFRYRTKKLGLDDK